MAKPRLPEPSPPETRSAVQAPAAAPAARPDRPPPVKGQSPAGPGQPGREDLPDDRVRQLYAQYIETRRRQKESTADLPFDAVAKNLRDSGARLREKHGKAIDFEVVVKDGKTFLRPIVK